MHEPSRPFRGRLLVFAALLLVTWLPASAHHGWKSYLEDEFEVTGIVEAPVSTAGPHASLKIRANGKVWNVVLAPPARTQSAGLKSGMIPAGDTVTAYGHRHADPTIFEIKTERLRWNDRLFNVYPDRT